MSTRTPFLLSMGLVASMILFALVTAMRLPADAVLPTHWNAAGEPDSWSPALWALLIPALIFAATATLFAFLPRLEPLQDRLAGSSALLKATWLGMALLFCIVQLTIGLPAYGIAVPVDLIMFGMGLVLILIGNALPKSRPGFFVGIRTPWAITDTDNWIATHRLGGKLFMLAGAAILIASLLPIGAEAVAIVVLAAVGFAALVPYLYSWWLWRLKTDAVGASRPRQ